MGTDGFEQLWKFRDPSITCITLPRRERKMGVSHLLHEAFLDMKSVLFVAERCGRLSKLTSDRYPLRHVSQAKSVVSKGSRWRLPCRCSLSRLSRRCTRTPLWARPLKTARRLSHSICD